MEESGSSKIIQYYSDIIPEDLLYTIALELFYVDVKNLEIFISINYENLNRLQFPGLYPNIKKLTLYDKDFNNEFINRDLWRVLYKDLKLLIDSSKNYNQMEYQRMLGIKVPLKLNMVKPTRPGGSINPNLNLNNIIDIIDNEYNETVPLNEETINIIYLTYVYINYPNFYDKKDYLPVSQFIGKTLYECSKGLLNDTQIATREYLKTGRIRNLKLDSEEYEAFGDLQHEVWIYIFYYLLLHEKDGYIISEGFNGDSILDTWLENTGESPLADIDERFRKYITILAALVSHYFFSLI